MCFGVRALPGGVFFVPRPRAAHTGAAGMHTHHLPRDVGLLSPPLKRRLRLGRSSACLWKGSKNIWQPAVCLCNTRPARLHWRWVCACAPPARPQITPVIACVHVLLPPRRVTPARPWVWGPATRGGSRSTRAAHPPPPSASACTLDANALAPAPRAHPPPPPTPSLRTVGGEIGAASSLAPKVGPLGLVRGGGGGGGARTRRLVPRQHTLTPPFSPFSRPKRWVRTSKRRP